MTTRVRSYADVSKYGDLTQLDTLTGVETIKRANMLYTSFSKTMSDTVTPNFRKLIRAGEIISNPCSFSSVRHFTVPGEYYWYMSIDGQWQVRYYVHGNVTEYFWSLSPPVVPLYSLDPVPLADAAKAQAIANIDPSDFSFMEDLGEIRETVEFIRHPFNKLLKLSNDFRRKNRRALKRKLKPYELAQLVSDTWLEYRFAAKPLIMSAQSLAEAIQSKPVKPPQRRTSHGRAKDEKNKLDKLTKYYCTYNVAQRHRVEQHASIIYESVDPRASIASHYGLRMKDIPETAWALLPLSFMVDRVADISNMIRGLTNLSDPSIAIRSANLTTRQLYTKHRRIIEYDAPNMVIEGNDVIDETFSYTRVDWSPSIGDTVPNVSLYGLVDSATHVADLGALIISNLRLKR